MAQTRDTLEWEGHGRKVSASSATYSHEECLRAACRVGKVGGTLCSVLRNRDAFSGSMGGEVEVESTEAARKIVAVEGSCWAVVGLKSMDRRRDGLPTYVAYFFSPGATRRRLSVTALLLFFSKAIVAFLSSWPGQFALLL